MVVSAAILKSSIYATAVSRGRPTTQTYSSSSLALGEGKQTKQTNKNVQPKGLIKPALGLFISTTAADLNTYKQPQRFTSTGQSVCG